MTYPTFYQAWHNQPITSHSALLETKSVCSTFITQSINLEDLTQTLTTAIANEPTLNKSIHLICVNSGKFIDRDNPAAKIYAMVFLVRTLWLRS